MSQARPLETVVVCYTQTTFDKLAPAPASESDEPEDLGSEIEQNQARYRASLAERLVAGLQKTGCTAEVIRLPQRSFAPRDISRAAFAWRILDLKESNGRAIDLAVCLDFPAWSLQHPNKCVWLTGLPNFVVRATVGRPTSASDQPDEGQHDTNLIRLRRDETEAESAKQIAALLQAERRGLAEARRLLTANRPVAEEMARRGLQAEYNPLPTDLALPLDDPQWQSAIKRLLGRF